MAPLKPLRYREVKRRLEAAGFAQTSQKGSHVKFVRTTSEETRVVIVPLHAEVRMGTLRSNLNQAGLSPEEFAEL